MKLADLFTSVHPLFPLIPPPYIIAEVGVNHEGNMDLARRLITEAAEGGADAVKFQSYKAETIAAVNSPAYWDRTKEPTKSQYELFKKYDKFWKPEFEALKIYCDDAGIEFISTPFDTESATFLNDLMDVFKISSSDITNRPFIELIASFGKPVILSTGASYLHEIEEAVSWLEPCEKRLALLHCILNYPTKDDDANLAMITHLKQKFPGRIIGYSDHTLPKDMRTLETATLLGASILEKHFTHDKTLSGNDHYHAMDKADLALLKQNLTRILRLLGDGMKRPLPSEEISRQNARRSLVAAKGIPAGGFVTMADVTWKRPAAGISPKCIAEVVGKRARTEINANDIITWSMLDN